MDFAEIKAGARAFAANRGVRKMNLKTNMYFDKSFLLGRLQENRAQHKKIYDEAVQGFLVAAKKEALVFIDDLNETVGLLGEGQAVSLPLAYWKASLPKNHLDEYDTVIEMLVSTSQESMELSSREYRCLVMDKWDWKRDFLFSNSAYSISGRDEAVGGGFVVEGDLPRFEG